MLPKLALLWTQRRIIFFVATNHIEYFDAAIVRSERFDVLVFVPLPSFQKKMRALQERLGPDVSITVTQLEIEAAMARIAKLAARKRAEGLPKLPDKCVLAKFVLMRWDQIEELAFHLKPKILGVSGIIDARQFEKALAQIKDLRLGQLQPYFDYLTNVQYARRDFQRKPVYSVQNWPQGTDMPSGVIRTDSGVWLQCASGMCPDEVPGYGVERTSAGTVRLNRRDNREHH
jgi:hypothetical protein